MLSGSPDAGRTMQSSFARFRFRFPFSLHCIHLSPDSLSLCVKKDHADDICAAPIYNTLQITSQPHRFDFPIRFFILKKTFTPSHEGLFFLIFSSYKCEGFAFQAFTAKGRVFCRFLHGFQQFSGVKACFSHPSQAIESTIWGYGQLSQETANRKQKFSDITVNQNQEKSSIHSCECFVFQTFTPQIIEN